MKKLKIYVLALFFFSFLKINAGCGIKIHMQNHSVQGSPMISISTMYHIGNPNFQFLPSDTIIIRGSSSSCNLEPVICKLYFNDTLTYQGKHFVKFIAKPGKYIISCCLEGRTYISGGSTFKIENKLEVGINEYTNTNQWLSLFPNPSKESVTLNSFEENLKTVAIYNVNSELIEIIETDDNKITIPLSQYPQGLYILKVATLSNKIAIKKLIVQ